MNKPRHNIIGCRKRWFRPFAFLFIAQNCLAAEGSPFTAEMPRRVITVAASGIKGKDADYIGIAGLQEAIRSIQNGATSEIRLSGLFEAGPDDFIDCPIDSQKAIIPATNNLLISGGDRNKDGIIARFPDNLDIPYRNYNIIVSGVSMTLKNLNLTVKNLRYAIHIYGSSAKNCEFIIDNCIAIHEGNSGNALKSWPYPRPFGVGLSSNFLFTVKNSYVYSHQITPVNHGTNTPFSAPARVVYTNTHIKTGQGVVRSVWLYAQGSGQINTIELKKVELPEGDIGIGEGVWTPGLLDQQIANHNEFDLRMPEIPPRPYRCSTRGRALRIESLSTDRNSSVRFDEKSEAFALIVGNPEQPSKSVDQCFAYSFRDGGDGLPGFAMGTLSLQDDPLTFHKNKYICSLGKRLGDCSARPKILGIVIDGKRHEIIFDKNYDNVDEFTPPHFSNTDIIAEITAQLRPYATVSLYDPALEYYPEFRGMRRLKNHDVSSVRVGMGVVFTADNGFRKALNQDGRIDGICLDDGRVNDSCRVITEGKLWTAAAKQRFSIREKTTENHLIGVELGISGDKAGIFCPDAKPGLLKVVRPNVIEIKR